MLRYSQHLDESVLGYKNRKKHGIIQPAVDLREKKEQSILKFNTPRLSWLQLPLHCSPFD